LAFDLALRAHGGRAKSSRPARKRRINSTELGRFCSIARGSASELEYHLLLAKDLQFLPATLHEKLAADAVEIKRMLTALIQELTAES